MGRNEPNRNGAENVFDRGLPETDQTAYQLRAQREQQIAKERLDAIKSITDLSKKSINEISKFESSLIQQVTTYKEDLQKKFKEKIAAGNMEIAEAEKKIAKQVADYIIIVKQQAREREKQDEISLAKELYQAKKKDIADTAKLKRAENKKLSKEESQSIKDQIKQTIKGWKDTNKAKKDAAKEMDKTLKEQGVDLKGRLDARVEGRDKSKLFDDGWKAQMEKNGFEVLGNVVNKMLNNLKQMFDNTIQTYGTYQAKVNTRLQGSSSSWNGFGGTSNIENNIKSAVGATPYVKLQTVMDNVVKATEAGIANNVEQRAFLATVSENIASTFDAFDSNLMRVIRIQQADSTASRLGMEAGLTNFLNSYFSDNSYLNDAFDTVSQNIIEATSQLSAEQAVSVEYQIQKWLGSLYSVGFSSGAVGKISQALGYLGSGNISALSSDSAMQNLMVMAMNKAGLSYGDIMSNGLNENTTNKLLSSMVEYLEEIANSDNKVVKSQYAEVFGMSVSDLKAAQNLKDSLNDISNSSMGYSESMNELYYQMNQLTDRISIAGKLQNLYDNVNYSIGTSIASNPAMYALWQVTSAIEDLTGGIALPTFSVMGNMVDLNTTVTNLMRTGLVGVSTLANIGTIINGLNTIGNAGSILSKLGIGGSAAKTTTRGGGLSRRKNSLNQTSGSTYIGNTNGDDYYNQSLTSAQSDSDKQLDQKKAEATDITIDNIHEYLLSVFDPKITEIERFVALLAGYEVSSTNWKTTDFTAASGNYNATVVKVVENKEKSSSNDLLSNLNTTSKEILDLLKSVMDESGIKLRPTVGSAGFATTGGNI